MALLDSFTTKKRETAQRAGSILSPFEQSLVERAKPIVEAVGTATSNFAKTQVNNIRAVGKEVSVRDVAKELPSGVATTVKGIGKGVLALAEGFNEGVVRLFKSASEAVVGKEITDKVASNPILQDFGRVITGRTEERGAISTLQTIGKNVHADAVKHGATSEEAVLVSGFAVLGMGFIDSPFFAPGKGIKISSRGLREMIEASTDELAEQALKKEFRGLSETEVKLIAPSVRKATSEKEIQGAFEAAQQAAKEMKESAPQLTRQTDKGFFVNEFDTKGKLGFVPAEKAKLVDISPNIETFISKSRDKGWRVSESRTGTLIAEGKTQKEAIEKATQLIEKNKDNIETAIASAVKKGGVSPRFADNISRVEKAKKFEKAKNELRTLLETQPRNTEEANRLAAESRKKMEELVDIERKNLDLLRGGREPAVTKIRLSKEAEDKIIGQQILADLGLETQFNKITKPATKTPAPKLTKQQIADIKTVDNSPEFKSPTELSEKNIPAYQDSRGKIAKSKDALLEQIQDEMVRVRRIVEDKTLKITDESNPYDAEIAFHGRIGFRLEELDKSVKAIDKDIIKTAKKSGVDDSQFTKEVNEFLIARHAPERNVQLGDGAAGIKTTDANARVAEISKLPHGSEVKRIADDIQKINDETLDILKEGEVITDDLYNLLREKYKNHIPLFRVMGVEEDFAGGMARGFDVKGTGIKKAKGSKREVSDILGNVVYNYEQALIRAEKNRVDLATLKMVRDNKEAFGDLFTIRKPKAIGKTFDGKPMIEVVTDPQTLVLREKGKPVLIEIKDPQLAIALRGVGRNKISGVMRGVAAVTRTYSGIHTRFNPEFAFSNKVRDVQEALVYAGSQGELGVKGAVKIAAREARIENEKAVIDFIRGKDSEGAKLYRQMQEDGGTTGGLGLSTKKQIELDIDEIRKMNRSNPRKAAEKTLEYVENWNKVFEDSTRLSVYRQALENGVSRQRAAVLAKESSVNFNKFGRQGPYINALYMFSNASIQGTTKMLRAMKNPKVAAVVTTTVFGTVAAVAEWNNNVDPDWRNKVRIWDRLNSLAIMLPSGDGEDIKYITIPVSWGIKPIKVMADKTYDLATGEGEGLADASSAVLVSILEAYNPAGGTNVMSAITPTILDIPQELSSNRAWHGGNIRPDWDKNAPASIQYFDSLRDTATGRTAIGVSKGLSGVGMEVSPENIHYAYEQIIGGAGRFVNRTVNTLTAFGDSELPPTKEVPVVNRFYKSVPAQEVGAGAKEFEQIANILEEQSRERFYLNQQAEDSLRQLDEIPNTEAAKLFEEIRAVDPELAKQIVKIKKEQDKGLTFIDRKILQLGVQNGERAKFLKVKFDELKSTEEKAALWTEYQDKGIISGGVSKQLKILLKEDATPNK